MLKTTQNTKIDPIFAAIDAHRRATAIRYPILEKIGFSDGGPKCLSEEFLNHMNHL
jgi:hypothetical protein